MGRWAGCRFAGWFVNPISVYPGILSCRRRSVAGRLPFGGRFQTACLRCASRAVAPVGRAAVWRAGRGGVVRGADCLKF